MFSFEFATQERGHVSRIEKSCTKTFPFGLATIAAWFLHGTEPQFLVNFQVALRAESVGYRLPDLWGFMTITRASHDDRLDSPRY